ncbi:SBBP repeat-containing protein, partial [Anabaena sp. UHCC 0451]|uniref:SBBP repeat-containing protein n=1 Tax=Anabaena sp. UHCC 0451 TaxID=2055235 RepID=UPI002B1EE5C2
HYTLQVAASNNPWPVQFGTSGQEQNSGVSNDSSGSIFAAGFTTGAFTGNTNAGNPDGYITKYNPDGSQAWIKQFGTSGTDYAFGTGNDSAGNVYSAGYTNGAFAGATNLGSNDGFITKYTSAGTLAWVKQFGTAADDTSFGISVDSNGNSYVIGKTYGAFAGNVTQGAYDAYIAKYDTNGTQTWVKQLGTNQDDETIGVSLDSNNNIYVLGSTAGAFAGNTNVSGFDVFVSKYDSSGTQAWVKQLGSSGNNYANINGISSDSTGNVFITGYTDGTFSGNTSLGFYDGFVAKYSTTGTLAWVKQFGTSSEDYSIASKTDSAGNTYVTGWTNGQFTGNTALGGYDGFLAKYNTSGTRLWVKQFGTNSNDYANGLSIDNQGNIYVSGWTEYGSFPTYTNQGGSDSYIALFDTNGNQLSVPITSTVVPPNITLAVSPASVTEDGTTNLVYTFTRTGSTTNALTINYTVGGTATFNTDYTQTGAASFTSTTGTITFAAGSSTATLTIDPKADTTVEADETVALTLAAGTGYTTGTTTAVTGTITNDDVAPSVTMNLSADQTIVEGRTSPQNVTYQVTLSSTSTQTITVQYETSNGTATATSDYTSKTGTLMFNPGVTTQSIVIPILNDSINEANETFNLTLKSPTNASLGTKTSATTTITDTLTASVTTTLPTNVENLTLTGTTAINGTGNAGDNVFKGNSANNTLTGLNGNDTYSFVANAVLGTDKIVETATGGIDTIDFSGTTSSVNVNLGVITSQTVNSNLKLILSANNVIENATGGTGNDRLTGNALDNLLVGGEGNDQLQGLGGNDILWGGLGDDILNGGVGNDQYRFQSNGVFSSSLGVDYITQFEAGQDQIALSLSTFNAITNTVGQALTDFAVVTDDELVNASSAKIVYSQSTGSLFYNQDGNVLGTASVFEFARLGNLDITLNSSNFSLIS